MSKLQNKLVPLVPPVQGTNSTNGTNRYRYELEKGSKKHLCPECGKKKFVRYIDTQTGEYLPEQFGRCDREAKCSYHFDPYKSGYSKEIWEQEKGDYSAAFKTWTPPQKMIVPKPEPKPVYFDFETFKKTLQPERYEKNIFIQNLLSNIPFPFDMDDVTKVIELYRLGTITNWYRAGAITFPFIDLKGNIRAIQVKQFDRQNHTTGTDFLHSIIEKYYTRNNEPLPEWLEAYTKQDKRISCLFGEHLLNKYPNNPIILVEAPKTAIYGTLYFGLPEKPESFIWLAVYNKSSFSIDKLKALQGRNVFVFPDLSKDGNTFKGWEAQAKEYEKQLPGTRFIFSDLLEQLAPEQDRKDGKDIADFLIKLDWRLFRNLKAEQPIQANPEITEIIPPSESLKNSEVQLIAPEDIPAIREEEAYVFERPKRKQTENWTNEIEELENYFANIETPEQPFKLNKCTTIVNYSKFIESHLTVVRKYNGNNTFKPFLMRLRELKQGLIFF